jgi:hypothetical protein
MFSPPIVFMPKTKKAAVSSSGAAAKIRYDWYKNLIRQALL